MDRKLIFSVMVALLVFSTPSVWAAGTGSENAAIQGADSEMSQMGKDMDQQNAEDTLDSAPVDGDGLITNDTNDGTVMTSVTSKKTRTVVKETTTTQNPGGSEAPKPQPKPEPTPQYIK